MAPKGIVSSSKINFQNWKKCSNTSESYKTNWFSILVNQGFHVLEYLSPQVVLLPIIANSAVLLVKVKRPVIATSTWELPAGGLEKDENAKEGALRELREETGISVKDQARLEPMNPLVVSPTRMPMFPNLFSINLSLKEFKDRLPHDDEVERVDMFSFKKLREMILDEEIYVTLPLAILSRFLLSQEDSV